MRASVVGGIALALSATAFAEEPGDDPDGIIARTRETSATYSLFSWNIITLPNLPVQEEWAAEFHKGNLHRVETPRDRIVADCLVMTGTYLRLGTGKTTEGPAVARAACGIQANSQVLESRITGSSTGRFGVTHSVLVRDPTNVRTYEVAANGALVAATIDDLESNRLLKSFAIELSPTAPEDIFTVESLSRSAVPVEFRTHSAK